MHLLPLLCLLALPLPAAAETLSKEIGRTGLSQTATRLEALPSPGPADLFALGGVRFLGTIEAALQLRWRSGLSDPTGLLPFLRLPMAENPTPPPIDPALFAELFTMTSQRMDAARAPLDALPTDAAFSVEIDLSDLWFDINANTGRDPGEDALQVLGPIIMGFGFTPYDPSGPWPAIKFNAADAAWLSAYTHMLQGTAEMLLAYDPTEPISRILQARAAMEQLSPLSPDMFLGSGKSGPDGIDIFATFLATLQQTPDTPRMRAAHDHFLSAIADNRRFWATVDLEMDNDAEWLPNDRQKPALGIELSIGTGAAWMDILTDAEDILRGKKLVPFWRFEGAAFDGTDPAPAKGASMSERCLPTRAQLIWQVGFKVGLRSPILKRVQWSAGKAGTACKTCWAVAAFRSYFI